jgi:ABC-type transporter MlaC component
MNKTAKILIASAFAVVVGIAAIAKIQATAQQAADIQSIVPSQPADSQGKEVCRQSLHKLAKLTIKMGPDAQTVGVLVKKDWQQLSLTEKKLFVEAFETMTASYAEGFKTMTLRRVNSCPPHEVEETYAGQTEESISKLEDILVKLQDNLTLDQASQFLAPYR